LEFGPTRRRVSAAEASRGVTPVDGPDFFTTEDTENH